LSATDKSDWSNAARYANAAYLLSQDIHSYYFSHIHDLIVTAATTSIDSHNNTFLIEKVLANSVEEIDLEDQDSFAYFYTKFVLICGFLGISSFKTVKAIYKYFKFRKILL
jgi:hypothetical protein